MNASVERPRRAVATCATAASTTGSTTSPVTSSRALAAIAERLGPVRAERWLADAHAEVRDRTLILATPRAFAARWIESNLADELCAVARELLGPEAVARVRLDEGVARREGPTEADRAAQVAEENRRAAAAAFAPSGAGRLGHGGAAGGVRPRSGVESGGARRPRPRGPRLRSLEDFVVGPCNRLAFSAATQLLDDEADPAVSPLFVHGECGVGKTHLLQGVCRRFIDSVQAQGRTPRVRYVTGEQFTNEYILAIKSGSLEAFRASVRRLDLLAIDDVHFLSNKVRTQSEFLHTLDAIDLTGARIVLASDEHPNHIRRFSRALVSRFLSGMVVEVERPDRETRIEIVRRLCAERGLRLNEQAIDAVASRCVGSVRELEGAAVKLAAVHGLLGGRGEQDVIGMVTVEQALDGGATRSARPVRLATIVSAVSGELDVPRTELASASRRRDAVLARGVVAHLARSLTTASYPEIARALGREHHSTIHAAARRVEQQVTEDARVRLGGGRETRVRELVDQLRHAVQSGDRERETTAAG